MKSEIEKEALFGKIAALIELARERVATTVNLTMVNTYFEIGRMIVENEQQGKERAEYGKAVLIDLSSQLTAKFGKGFSVENLDRMRFFYKVYSLPISSTVLTKFQINDNQSNSATPLLNPDNSSNSVDSIQQKSYTELQRPQFQLSWSHYLVLMRIADPQERSFYEIESAANNWSLAVLKRQCNSSLYERLALSRDKDEVMKLSQQGQTIEKANDLIKNPLTLEFLGLQEKHNYSESDLEAAILGKLQNFLLELGKGFLFEARQKRFSFDEENFYVDLVFYNRLLQCYVLIDLKTDKLAHQDLGQMQMYVNYFDRFVKLPHEKPTIGILLCKEKKDALVKLTLPQDTKIYASEYSLYLPDKQVLQTRLKEWMNEFENNRELYNIDKGGLD